MDETSELIPAHCFIKIQGSRGKLLAGSKKPTRISGERDRWNPKGFLYRATGPFHSGYRCAFEPFMELVFHDRHALVCTLSDWSSLFSTCLNPKAEAW